MAIEIERRFVVRDPDAALAPASLIGWQCIDQGYFARIASLRIRVRILADADGRRRARLSLKGPRSLFGRIEYEYPLALTAAQRALRRLPPTQVIRKIRYRVRHDDGHIWSVDVFQGANAGLVLAEVELARPEQAFAKPSWAGAEITFDRRYGNSALACRPMPLLPQAA